MPIKHILFAVLLAAAPSIVLAEDNHRVLVNGMQMYYEVSGSGAPIVVLHGAHMNILTMGNVIPALARTHTVYAVEFQGHGRTEDVDRPITYENLADDVAVFMDQVHLGKADVFGYSMGAGVGLELAIKHPERVDHLVAASVFYEDDGLQPEYRTFADAMTPADLMPFEDDWKKLAPHPDGYAAFAAKMVALEREPIDWRAGVEAMKTPVLIIASDSDLVTLEHTVSLFRLLGGGVAGDMGHPLATSRLAVLPATSHTAFLGQIDLLLGFIEPFLNGETPKGYFD